LEGRFLNLSHRARRKAGAVCLAALFAFAAFFFGCAFAQEIPHDFIGTEGVYGGGETGPLYETEEFQEDEIPLGRMTVAELEELEAEGENPLNALNSFLLVALSAGVFGLLYWLGGFSTSILDAKNFVPLALIGAIAVRLFVAALSPGYTSDMACFTGWAKALADNGCAAFYTSGMFADYPPGYLYVLLAMGKLASLFGINLASSFGGFFIRLPVILLDAGLAYVLYRAARDSLGRRGAAALLLIAAFNPVSILDSAAWGQVDSALTLLLVLSFIQLQKERKLTAAALFGLAVLVKPQALIAGPVFALGYLFPLLDGGKDEFFRRLADIALGAVIALAVIFVGSLPFQGSQDTFFVFRRMLETATSYPYGSANAFNLIALLGGNWVLDSTVFLGLSIRIWGIVGILLSLAATIFAALRARKRGTLSLPLLAALFLTLVFTLGHNMHERYLFPALFLLLLALPERKDRRLLTAHHALSAALFLNAAAVLLCVFYGEYNLIGKMDGAVRLFSLLGVCAAGYFAWVCYRVLVLGEQRKDAFLELTSKGLSCESPEDGEAPPEEQALFEDAGGDNPQPEGGDGEGHDGDGDSIIIDGGEQLAEAGENGDRPTAFGKPLAELKPRHPAWTRREKLLLWALSVIYAIVAFVNLGDLRAPETVFSCKDGQQVVVTLPEEAKPAAVWAYANICQGKLGVYAASGGTGSLAATVDLGYDHMFRWTITPLELSDESTAKFSVKAFGDCKVNELVFVDAEGNVILPERVSYYDGTAYVDASEALKAFDEQDKKPLRPSEQNGMYFDELYHGRTAYEHLHGLKPYENSHPPLGKVLIMAGIAVLGMTPFGWRFAGALFGVFMLPALYFLVRRVTKSPKWAFFATALMAVDFMHFTQTRIATIDVFVTFFIILMYYFMFRYYELDWNEVGLKKTLVPLGLAGVCFGLGAASKWTGIYAGLGLAVLLFITLYQRIQDRRLALKSGDAIDIACTDGTAKNVVLTLLFCVGAYIVVPLAIYLLSYLPYFLCAESPYTLQGVWEVQEFMFGYHSKLTAMHPYSSKWFTWPLSIRPIWYYQGKYLAESMIESIVSFGNPGVWWTGAFGMIALIVQRIRRSAWSNAAATFALIGFAAQFLPWVFISRATFIYHYFPSVPFVILALTFALMAWEQRSELGADVTRLLRVALPIAALLLFAAFYPILSGAEVARWYASNLRWFPSWTFFI
jgi:dolichyl-phosphate-mannose-protein mannosyltransferase